MTLNPAFTLCFLLHGDDVLLLHRKYPPNQGLWNGVGGHIEPGETPRQAVIREVAEESGYAIADPRFAGVLTWDGFEIPPSAIAIFTAAVTDRHFVNNHEGDLAWHPRAWACKSPEVVDNIHTFLPRILTEESPHRFHFSYRNGDLVGQRITPLPAEFDIGQPYQPTNGLLEEQRGAFLLSTDRDRLQLPVLEAFLSEQSYWAKGRARDVIETSINNSVCFGIYREGLQVAFARLVTDQATFAWLCDVFVDARQRDAGLGKWLVETACRYADQHGIDRTILATRDAHSLYEDYGGFHPLEAPDGWLTRTYPEARKPE